MVGGLSIAHSAAILFSPRELIHNSDDSWRARRNVTGTPCIFS